MKQFLILLCLIPILSKGQIINTIAGTGAPAYMGDGFAATLAKLDNPACVVADASGNVYIADYGNSVIRKINPSGIISTIAGTGTAGYNGDNMQATLAQLSHPNGVLVDGSGNITFCDYGNNRIRRINSSGVISTIAGTGAAGYFGDGGAATSAKLYLPTNIAIDASGNIYIADAANQYIRKINPSGIISTIAGTGFSGYNGDNIPATTANLNNPYGIALDAAGNIYIGDQGNNRVRKINSSGTITTLAGTGASGYMGDGFAATTAQLNTPTQIWVDASSNDIYIADRFNNCVRKVNSLGIISTVAGNGTPGFSGDNGPATAAEAHEVPGVSLDIYGNMYIADFGNNRIREVLSCASVFSNSPTNDTVLLGNTAKYWVTTSLSTPIYQWQQNAGGAGWVDLANAWPYSGVTTDTLTIHNASMFVDTTYYRCYVIGDNPCGDTSAAAILYIKGSSTGIGNLALGDINIYPNPAHNNLTISLPQQNKGGLVQMINEIGQVVAEQKITGTATIDISSLPDGLYIVRAQVEGQYIYRKIVKN